MYLYLAILLPYKMASNKLVLDVRSYHYATSLSEDAGIAVAELNCLAPATNSASTDSKSVIEITPADWKQWLDNQGTLEDQGHPAARGRRLGIFRKVGIEAIRPSVRARFRKPEGSSDSMSTCDLAKTDPRGVFATINCQANMNSILLYGISKETVNASKARSSSKSHRRPRSNNLSY